VWLTPAQADQLKKTVGLPLDPGDNACAVVKLDRCATAANGKWEQVPGDPTQVAVFMMHAALLANTNTVLFWGYVDRPPGGVTPPNQTRLWDPTGGYTNPARQPANVPGVPNAFFANLHSAGHAYLDDAEGTLLAHGGETAPAPPSNTNNQQTFLFHPSTTQWELVNPTQGNRFYATTLTLDDGRLMTMFGYANTIEVFDPASKKWGDGLGGPVGSQLLLPPSIAYRFYPWAYLLPGGDIFIAGHQQVTTRFAWTPAVTIKGQWSNSGERSPGGELGTSVLLKLSPPTYVARVLNCAGASPLDQTAESIDLSQPMPVWTPLPPLKYARPQQCTATLLPDGRVFLSGGTGSPDPAEIFDPDNPAAGWTPTPPMTYTRGYHSSAILLTDGSVLVGGDRDGSGAVLTPHERFFPGYCFLPRPTIAGAPASVGHGANFTVNTPDAPSIAEVVLMRPGAVTHGFNQTQRLVGCTFTRGANTLSVQAPPNDAVGSNAAPPGWYLLFIVDAGRVPSVAKWIRLTP
jgi:hypothetical protein